MTTPLSERMALFQECIEQRDQRLATQILHPDYELVLLHPRLARVPRASWIDMLPDYVVDSYRVEEEVVEELADLAVVFHRAHMAATVLGEDRSGTFVITDVWRMGADGWQVWRRHSTPLAAGDMPSR
ncbi:MAG: nuclear transport factor 2 family protein [Candidatus Nanopelagicales bacterium]